jgi:hypothetical protein
MAPRSLLAALASVAAAGLLPAGSSPPRFEPPEGLAPGIRDSTRPTITAHFVQDSYRPGDLATLIVSSRATAAQLQIFRVGPERKYTRARDEMSGVPVSAEQRLGTVGAGLVVPVRVGAWPSGVYFARLEGSGSHTGFAPFVVRPARLGEHRVAIVMPNQTWQAYNHRDDDHDGVDDTWYVAGDTARLGRAHLNRGVPFRFRNYDAPFIRWSVQTHHDADFLTDDELNRTSGSRLAAAYSLIVFPGHHEYVTDHEYRAITEYRDLGGNLMFLSANDFYWKIDRHSDLMRRVARWRDLGRPEAALIGEQFFHNDDGERRGHWVVRSALPWLFAGTGLHRGSTFSSGGVEADAVAPSSPPGVRIVAEIPNLFPGFGSAQMTYYERGGAKVFSAGAFTLAGAIWEPAVNRLLSNLWARLAADTDQGCATTISGSVSRRRNANHTNGSATRICPTPIASSTSRAP